MLPSRRTTSDMDKGCIYTLQSSKWRFLSVIDFDLKMHFPEACVNRRLS